MAIDDEQEPETHTITFTADELAHMVSAIGFLHALRPLPEPQLSSARSAIEKVAAATGQPLTLEILAMQVEAIRSLL